MRTSTDELTKENVKLKFKEMKEEELKEIVEFISKQGHYHEFGKYIIFRLFNAVSERDEVFIGNVLFNDYLSKLVLRVYNESEKYTGHIELVYNNLEIFYYIVEQNDKESFS